MAQRHVWFIYENHSPLLTAVIFGAASAVTWLLPRAVLAEDGHHVPPRSADPHPPRAIGAGFGERNPAATHAGKRWNDRRSTRKPLFNSPRGFLGAASRWT
jgi:hypothetical protein